ncbi:hypothetical protein DTO271G3_3669 [Paecilomyces variotii]|nr:hypothetical protein DTO271G3_3669 [Paecilomyces variotii]
MATWAYPPLAPEQLKREEDSALAKELKWLLSSLQESLASLREGLQECRALLAPKEPGSTLVLSSPRSESLKGFVTRVGTKVIKGDIQLRLASLPPPRGATSTRLCLSTVPGAPELVLRQLASVRDSINQSLDVVDVGTYTGDPYNANFISGQLHLLRENVAEACLALKGETDKVKGKWWEANVDENAFDPPLPPYVSFHLVIEEAALVLYIRTLEPSSASNSPASFTPDISISGFSIRERLFGPRLPPHDEAGQVFIWKGQEVKVKDKIRVESQDPCLMSAMSKITALQHEVQKWIAAVNVVMGQDDSVNEE